MLAVLALSVALQAPPALPPKHSYDSKLDVTTYSSGDIRTGEMSGMSAEFTFPGKIPARPGFVSMGFGSLRVPDQAHHQPDVALQQWKDVTRVDLEYGKLTLSLPATQGFQVSHNKMVELFFGHAIEEHVNIKLTPEQYIELVGSPAFQVRFGKESETIKGKALVPLRKLAASIPIGS